MATTPTDRQERERVVSRIGKLIVIFCQRQPGPFHMDELRRFVEHELGGKIAPDSPGRILRQLRQQRRLNYTVICRRKSLYLVRPVAERPAEQAELFARAS